MVRLMVEGMLKRWQRAGRVGDSFLSNATNG